MPDKRSSKHPAPKAPLITQVVIVDPNHPDDKDLRVAAELIRAGKVVAFPTETVYGLGADALNPDAVRAIFAAKGRPADNPLIVHIADRKDLLMIAAWLPACAAPLIDRFMPGPLTLILPRAKMVPDVVTAGLDTVAVRIPEHPVARRLIELAGVPIAAPSANRSGRPSPTTAAHVLEDLDGVIPLIVDGGACCFGLESTVLDITGPIPVILRPGAVSAEEIIKVIGPIRTAEESQSAEMRSAAGGHLSTAVPRSPGMKYRHYAPKTPLRIAEGPDQPTRSLQVVHQVLGAIRSGLKPAVFASNETAALVAKSLPLGYVRVDSDAPDAGFSEAGLKTRQPIPVFVIAHGPCGQARTAASQLFAALRKLDGLQADLIIAESVEETGIGVAYLNRLRKAAGGGAEPSPGTAEVKP